jgi:phage shock protein PspC (stress-responsive transcriptional regulator)
VHPPWRILGPVFGTLFLLAAALTYWDIAQMRAQAEKKIEQIEVKAEQEPDKTKFAWDLARVKLEAYFDRNLSQVRMIFVVAVLVMIVGFGFVMWGVTLAITKPEAVKTSYVAAASGIITQFIGVTFMVIYRSTMAQANQFMNVLERINTVGMAVQILDAIPDASAELKNKTRAEIVSLLLKGSKLA